MAKVPSTSPDNEQIGVDQHDVRPLAGASVGAAALRNVGPLLLIRETAQEQFVAVSSTKRHKASRTSASECPEATISSSRFSPASCVSARLRSWTSINRLYHRTMRPCESRSGKPRD